MTENRKKHLAAQLALEKQVSAKQLQIDALTKQVSANDICKLGRFLAFQMWSALTGIAQIKDLSINSP